MAINYIIQAQVVDITTDSPKADDVFLVDTNVWYWMTYTRASLSARPPAQYQTTNYPTYTNAALAAGARIYQSGFSLADRNSSVYSQQERHCCRPRSGETEGALREMGS